MSRFVVLLLCAAACSKTGGRREEVTVPGSDSHTAAPPAADAPTVTFQTPAGEVTVQAEIVSTPAAIQKGLMFREHLPPEAGMLFLMGREEDWPFYMKNTLIPLDMIFITQNLTVAGVVANAAPQTLTNRRVGRPSSFVLEVNGGWAAAHQVGAGTRVKFHGVPRVSQPYAE